MKKVFLMSTAIVAFTLASCGGKTAPNANNTDSSVVDTTAMANGNMQNAADSIISVLSAQLNAKDTKGLQTTVQSVIEKYSKLISSGNIEAAKAYASKVQAFFNEHADQIDSVTDGNSTITTLVNNIKTLPTNVETTATDAASAMKGDAENLIKKAKQNAKDAAEKKADETVDAAKDKTNKAIDEAKKKSNEIADKAKKELGL